MLDGQGDMSDPLVQKTWYGGIDAVDIGLPPLEDEASPTCGTNHVTSKTCSMKGRDHVVPYTSV